MRPGQRLQPVDQVVQAHGRLLLRGVGRAFVVPGCPGQLSPRQHRRVGVQHGAVRLVADGAEQRALVVAGVGQQGQALVAVAGQHHLVETFAAGVGGDDHRRQPLRRTETHWGAQPRVGDVRQHLLHVLPRAADHGVPLRPVADLDQAVVVAEADHRGDREAQHLVGGAGPDAAEHRQQVPIAEGLAEAMARQEIADRLGHRRRVAGLGQCAGQAVEAQDLRQHAQEARAQQVAALREHGVQVAAAPFDALLRHLHREGHLRRRSGHAEHRRTSSTRRG